ncbi:hypothetical protein IFR05_003607 [Cadophora sp. M221]|nr:hypothetical protein IFR05_003607 [Cadophora sp. M221]
MSNSRQVNTKVDTIAIKGNQFVSEANGSQFYFYGINFGGKTRQAFDGSLLDSDDCSLTIPGLLALGINVVLVTITDTTRDRTICMEKFQAAGIYLLVIFDVSDGLSQFETDWNSDEYLDQTKLIDYSSPYSNVMGFVLYTSSLGLLPAQRTRGLAFIKARIRDVKQHMQSNGYRQIPIGLIEYSSTMLEVTAQYFRCGNSTSEIGDFWVFLENIECEDETPRPFEDVMKDRSKAYQRFEVPLVIMDKSCSQGRARNFTWVTPLFGPPLSAVWSGAVFDDWYSLEEGYGIVANIQGNSRSSESILSPGGIAGVAIGAAIFMLMIIGSIGLWRRKKPGKTSMANTSSEGLEVGEAPPGLGHNVELGGSGPEIELGTTENAIELPDSVPPQELGDGIMTTRLSTMGSLGNGGYTVVSRVDPEVEGGVTTTAEDIILAKEIKRKPLASEISSSWADTAWFDPNDSRQVLPSGSVSRPDGQGD